MRLVALVLVVILSGGTHAQEASAEGPGKIDAPRKYKLLINEVAVALSLAETPLDDIAANYEKLRKSGDCTERRSYQLTIWQDQEFEFIQTSEVTLLDHLSARDGNVTRVAERIRLGFGLRALLSSSDDKLKLKIDYQNAFVDELTPNTKTSDVEMHSASAEAPIAARKRLAIRIENAEDRSILLVSLLPLQ